MSLVAGDTPLANIASLQRHAAIALLVIGGLCGGGVFWAASTDIEGAIVTTGTLVVESHSKDVQHQDGGTVREVLVDDDQPVAAGQILLHLDDTSIRASLSAVTSQFNEALVEATRLSAQIKGAAQFDLPAELSAGNAEIADLATTQQSVLAAAIADRDGRIGQLNEQIAQLGHQIDGLGLQQASANTQLDILTSRVADLSGLYSQHLAGAADLSSLRLQQAAAEGEKGRLISASAEARATIAEKALAIEQIKTDFLSQALDELQKARATVAQVRQQKIALEDKLARTIIRAPEGGIVHELVVHTVGGVITPGQTLMQIVPQSDNLLVSIHIDPADINALHPGQNVNLRFTSLDKRGTPEATGEIASISPDLVIEQQTGRRYYTANVRIDPASLEQLPDSAKLVPGMPVEAFATTGARSVLNYLLHPLLEEWQLAFRER